MNKIYRIKSATGGLAIRLDHITAIRYLNSEGSEDHAIEIITPYQALDAVLTTAELEGLQNAWNQAL